MLQEQASFCQVGKAEELSELLGQFSIFLLGGILVGSWTIPSNFLNYLEGKPERTLFYLGFWENSVSYLVPTIHLQVLGSFWQVVALISGALGLAQGAKD